MFTGGALQTNGWVIEAAEGPVLFDAPGGVCRWLAERGIRPVFLALTHGHFDHIEEAALVMRTFGCPAGIHPLDRRMTSTPGYFSAWGVDVEPCEPQVSFDAEGPAVIAGTEFELFHVPGHSPGSVCFYLRDRGLLAGGDVLFAGGIGRWDLPGGDGALLQRGINGKLMALPDETRVLPGHGPATTIGAERRANPFLRMPL